ncbi:MAG: spermidine/putrescine ABC transporter substrate-binding protein [Actinomycetota bacterium]
MTMHPREGGRKRPFGLGGTPMDRRAFLRTTGLTAASIPLASAILAACTDPTKQGKVDESVLNPARPDNPVTLPVNQADMIADGLKPEAGPLELYNWEDYINPRIIGLFEEQYGVKVNRNTFNTEQEALGTLTATDTPYDVYFPSPNVLARLASSGLLRPLNKSYLPNLTNTWEVYHGTTPQTPFYDVGALYTVPYTVYTTGIGWRIDQPRGSAIAGPGEDVIPSMSNPYEILWDSAYKGKVHILDDYKEAIGMTLLKNGIYDVNTDDESTRAANLETARADLIEMVNNVDVKADITDYTDLPEGASLIHQGWSGDFVSVQYYFPDYQVDKDVIRYWAPSENMMIGNDMMAVVSSGKNPVLAHHFLNFMLDFDANDNSGNSIVNFQWLGYLPPMAGLNKDDLIKGRGAWQTGRVVQPSLETCLPTEEDFTKGQILCELTPEIDREWQDVWDAFKAQG